MNPQQRVICHVGENPALGESLALEIQHAQPHSAPQGRTPMGAAETTG